MKKEDFLEHCINQPEALFDFLDNLICKKDNEISGLEDALDKLKNRNTQRMEGYESQIEKLIEERDNINMDKVTLLHFINKKFRADCLPVDQKALYTINLSNGFRLPPAHLA
jgi:hypothetical protein